MDSHQGGRHQRIEAIGAERGGEQPGVRGKAAAAEPIAKTFPPARLPALDRPHRPAQMPRRLLVGASLEVAEDQRRPVALGEPVDLLVEHPPQLVADLVRGSPASTSPRDVRAGAAGRPMTGHTTRCGRPLDGARGRENPAPRVPGPS